MTTAILSFWRTDASRELRKRAEHLLQKGRLGVRWIWVVGDSADDTEDQLRRLATPAVTLIRHDTGIVGEDSDTRLRRFSQTADVGLDAVTETDRRVLIHESDLRSPRDIVSRLACADDEAVGGWPVLPMPGHPIFYDTFVYRAHGTRFKAYPPYHAVYQPDARFEVDSVGSVWSLPAWAIRNGVRGQHEGALGICAGLRALGVRVLVDPQVEVVQPVHLWQAPHRAVVPA
jgi:hypothetical protein